MWLFQKGNSILILTLLRQLPSFFSKKARIKQYINVYQMKKFTLKSLFTIFCLTLMLGSCDNENDNLELHSDPGTSFLDVENDGYMVTLAAQAPPEGLVGTWQIYMGENGTFEDVNNPQSIFYGEPGETYNLGWEVSYKGKYESSAITVSFKPLQPVLHNVSMDTLHNNMSIYLEADAPTFGASGEWEIVSGSGGRIENAQNYEAQFIGKADETYSIKWNLIYGSKVESAEFSFLTDELQAHAGEDRLDVKTANGEDKYCLLDGFLPAGATGEWEIIEGVGGFVHSIDNPNSILEGLGDSTYTLIWKVELDQYQSVDTVDIRFRDKWGVWTDSRDGQTYRYTEVNGLEWMSENFNYAYEPGYSSWYYGQMERSVIGSGHALETEEDRKHYGRLYNWYAAYEATPEGWRLPKEEDFQALVMYYGGNIYAGEDIIAGGSGESGIDFNFGGYLELYSFTDPAIRNSFDHMENFGLYWTRDYLSNTRVTAFSFSSNANDFGISYPYAEWYGLSVRYVRDVE